MPPKNAKPPAPENKVKKVVWEKTETKYVTDGKVAKLKWTSPAGLITRIPTAPGHQATRLPFTVEEDADGKYTGRRFRTLTEARDFAESAYRQKETSSSAGADIDSDGKVEKDEKEFVSARAKVNEANQDRLDLTLSPDNPKLRDAHGKWLSRSEDLAEAVAEYKDNRDRTKLSAKEKKAVSMAAGASDKRPTATAGKPGRGKKGMRH